MRIGTLMSALDQWWEAIAGKTKNVWCLLGCKDQLTRANIQTYFDRTEVNKECVARYNESNLMKKKDHLTYSAEISYIYGFSKSFAARHRTRLQLYADDWSNKKVRTASAVNIGYSSFLFMRRMGEQFYNDKNSR